MKHLTHLHTVVCPPRCFEREAAIWLQGSAVGIVTDASSQGEEEEGASGAQSSCTCWIQTGLPSAVAATHAAAHQGPGVECQSPPCQQQLEVEHI
jgi:hypothetical protein